MRLLLLVCTDTKGHGPARHPAAMSICDGNGFLGGYCSGSVPGPLPFPLLSPPVHFLNILLLYIHYIAFIFSLKKGLGTGLNTSPILESGRSPNVSSIAKAPARYRAGARTDDVGDARRMVLKNG